MSPTPPTHIQNLADDYVPRPAILAVAHFPRSYPGQLGSGLPSDTGQDAGEATGVAVDGVVLISGPGATAGVVLVKLFGRERIVCLMWVRVVRAFGRCSCRVKDASSY